MRADRHAIRRLVERELSRRLSASSTPPHPALLELAGPFEHVEDPAVAFGVHGRPRSV